MTFREYIEYHWFPNLERRQVRPSTLSSYASMLQQHIYPQWAKRDLDAITPPSVETLLSSMQGYSPKYQRNVAMLLRAAFHHAVESGELEHSPVRDYHMPKVVHHEKPVWSQEEISALLASIPARYRSLFQIAAVTGMRLGELLGLTWDDCDLAHGTISIRHSLWAGRNFSPKTEASRRSLPIPRSLSAMLEAHRQDEAQVRPEGVAGSDFVFRTDIGRPLSPVVLRRDILYPALERLGMAWAPREGGFHRFRHSAGSIIVSKTGNLKLAQRILGHSSITTTADIYTHVRERELTDALQGLEDAISPVAPGAQPILKG